MKVLQKKFIAHLGRNSALGLALIALSLYSGMLGYHEFEKLSWVDSFLNASMILSGMGPVSDLKTNAGKIFSGCYALYSGLAFIASLAIIFAPIINSFLRDIHIDVLDDMDKKSNK